MKCGLLGKKLTHSYSPAIHHALGDYAYELFEIAPDTLGAFLKGNDFSGINVTIPYKKDVIPYCTELSPIAKRLGAVNTIVRHSDGTLMGHNTDYFGFSFLLQKSGLQASGKKVLILGSGGAAVTVEAALNDLGALPVIISRSGPDNYENLHKHEDAAIIVNATPVGMFPNNGISPVDLSVFPRLEGVLDLIYNPAKTQLLLQAEDLGLAAENGLWMLVAQAKESAEWFTGHALPNDLIDKIHKQLSREMENLVLIGMPGCGKTTIGTALADKLGRTFVDLDAEIVKHAGKSIPEIFDQVGEPGFRALESAVIHEFGKKSGLVIATGGGCVTQQENYSGLHQNGKIIWLQRDISALPTEGRPLSQASSLDDMYRIRKPLYEAFADISIQNSHEPEKAIHTILTALEQEV